MTANVADDNQTYEVILAAVDGSPRSAAVVAAAVAIADPFGAQVHLFRAVTVPPEFPPAAHAPADALPGVLEAEARRSLGLLAAGHPLMIVESPDLEPIQPWLAILKAAERVKADLIVIGSHGYGGWDRLIGTNAAKVADNADRNVLIVHEPKA